MTTFYSTLISSDPHIRVGGPDEQVQKLQTPVFPKQFQAQIKTFASLHQSVRRAKSLVMEYLDTRSNRVTLKMDVSYTDHSHVIGKGGEKRTEEVFYLFLY